MLVTAIITLCYLSALAIWFLFDNSAYSKLKTFKLHKTWIFMMLVVYEFFVTIKYLFNISKDFDVFVQSFCQVI